MFVPSTTQARAPEAAVLRAGVGLLASARSLIRLHLGLGVLGGCDGEPGSQLGGRVVQDVRLVLVAQEAERWVTLEHRDEVVRSVLRARTQLDARARGLGAKGELRYGPLLDGQRHI